MARTVAGRSAQILSPKGGYLMEEKIAEKDSRKPIQVPAWGAASGGLTFVVLVWLFRTQAWLGILVAVVGTVLIGVVGWMLWVGHRDAEDERLLMILLPEPGMPSDQFRAPSGLSPDEYALAVHRPKDGWWIEWQWGAYHLTPIF
jgi:hypothetical protein